MCSKGLAPIGTSNGASSPIIVKPKEDQTLATIFKDLSIQSGPDLATLFVESVEVYPDECQWVINLTSPCLLEADFVTCIAKAFESKAQNISRVEINVSVRPPITTESNAISNEWEDIIETIKAEIPAATGFISGATWQHIDGTLYIGVLGELGCKFLSAPDRNQVVETIIRKKTGLCPPIRFIVRDDIPEDDWLLEAKDTIDIKNTIPQDSKGCIGDTRCLLGKEINDRSTPISSIQDGMKSVTIEGNALETQVRQLRNGRSALKFVLTDYTNSIYVKMISKKDQALPEIEDGMYLRVKGRVVHDRYEEELVIEPRCIMVCQELKRLDTAPEKRVELHLHTKMSAMDAVADIQEVIKTISEWGHGVLAITDHGVIQGFPSAHECASKLGIKLIFGIEAYLIDQPSDDAKPYHCTILAKNKLGLRNLYQLVSLSHLEYFHRHPRIPRKELDLKREGLLVGSACQAGELFQSLLNGASDEQLIKTASYYDYLEIQPIQNNAFLVEQGKVRNIDELKAINKRIYDIGKHIGALVVATGDVHYLDPKDCIYRQILQAGQGYQDSEKGTSFYLKTTDEMKHEFNYLGAEISHEVTVLNPRAIADMVEDMKPVPDGLFAPTIEGAEEEIVERAKNESIRLYGQPLPKIVRERLDREIESIVKNDYSVIYLIASKLVEKSLIDGYLVGSRGSVGSSLVARLCGITEVNPLVPHYRCESCHYSEFVTDGSVGSGFDLPSKNCPGCGMPLVKDGHDIPFEVFLGFEGDKVPDIDLNFSGENQGDIHKFVEKLLGKDCVFRAGTIATIVEKTAFGFVRGYIEDNGLCLRKAEVARLARGLTGVKRTTGQHPGGVMIVPKGLDVAHFTPLQHPADDKKSDTITTHFDYESISSRLVKLDILGHDDPTAIRFLQDLTGIDASKIPFDDPKTLSIFSSAEELMLDDAAKQTVGAAGIPEFGTRFVRGMLEATRPQTFAELVRISGLSHGTDVWLNNAHDLIRKKIASLAQVISTRDDIMIYLIRQGVAPRTSFKIMEKVRRGRGLAPEDEELMLKASVPQWYIKSCNKIKYMFPKAHAVAYVMMAFRIAYFKVHYPTAFYAVYFSLRVEDLDIRLISEGPGAWAKKIAEIDQKGNEASAKEKDTQTVLEVALEMSGRGGRFAQINLYKSDPRRYLITDAGLLPPLLAIPGLGQNAARNIVKARQQGAFISVEDLRTRARLNKNVIELLAEFNCLKDLPETNQIGLF